MDFGDFAALCRDLERTPSRLAKIAAAAEYLRRLKSDEIRPAVAFLSGRPFQASDPRTLDIGTGAFAHIAGVPPTQPAVLPRLTIIDVAESFAAIAEASGSRWRPGGATGLKENQSVVVRQEHGRDGAVGLGDHPETRSVDCRIRRQEPCPVS